MFWVDKYRPVKFSQLDCHPTLTPRLERLVSRGDFPHLLVYGPPGAGKKTRINCMLREMFGSSVERLRVEHRSWKVNSKTVDLATVGSSNHIELSPCDVGPTADRAIVQEVLKEIAQVCHQQTNISHSHSLSLSLS